jgi:hypothetical protein
VKQGFGGHNYGFQGCTGFLALQNSKIDKLFEKNVFFGEFLNPYNWA